MCGGRGYGNFLNLPLHFAINLTLFSTIKSINTHIPKNKEKNLKASRDKEDCL